MSTLAVENLHKMFGQLTVLNGISFLVRKDEFVSILGASGCGKSTLLRVIAGLESCNKGKIIKDGQDVTNVHTAERNIGMVFQNYSLFPNMTVKQNISYALKYSKYKKKDDSDLVNKVIEKCELKNVLKKYPYQLSGGQQQRTAIARSLVMSPDILLLDEPFSALDASLRHNLRKLIKQFQREFHISIIYVTHDQEEAFTLSDSIVIINQGVVEQIGSPNEIYCSPCNDYVNDFTHKQLKEKYFDLGKIVQIAKA